MKGIDWLRSLMVSSHCAGCLLDLSASDLQALQNQTVIHTCGILIILNFLFFFAFLGFQGMEPFRRQEGRHLEFEVEWETGLSLQLQLEYAMPHLLRWASSDVRPCTTLFLCVCACVYERLESSV